MLRLLNFEVCVIRNGGSNKAAIWLHDVMDHERKRVVPCRDRTEVFQCLHQKTITAFGPFLQLTISGLCHIEYLYAISEFGGESPATNGNRYILQ